MPLKEVMDDFYARAGSHLGDLKKVFNE